MIAIGGAAGGLRTTRIARGLASRGYPALALAYMSQPGLPGRNDDIDVAYFAHAARWLARQPGVDPQRIVIMGGSFGGEAALLAASLYPTLFHGAIGLVPRSYVDPGWKRNGERLPIGMDIPVAKIAGPVLVIGAGRDQVWESADAVRQIAQTLRDAKFPFHHEEIVHEHAGHEIGSAMLSPEVLHFLQRVER